MVCDYIDFEIYTVIQFLHIIMIIALQWEKGKFRSMVHDHIDLRHIYTLLIEKCRILTTTSICYI